MGIVCAALVLLASPALAQDASTDDAADKVTIQPEGKLSRIVVRGTVLDSTGQFLKIRIRPANEVRTYPASEVLLVETPQTAEHVKGLLAFAQNRPSEAETSFLAALNAEQRTWVRREITAMLVRCALARGDYAAAGNRFLTLVKSDPHTPHFKLIPLVWSPLDSTAALRDAALAWRSEPGDIPRLLAASGLLRDAEHGAAADNDLRQLASSIDRRIADLAHTQLWRKRFAERTPFSPEELERWQSRIDTMPAELRGGPWYLLGQARRERREYDRAATALLWLPLVYHDDHHLAARACFDAAVSLGELGQADAARALYRETAQRFHSTSFAAEAAAALTPAPSPSPDDLPGSRNEF